jgi:hypothetical protein
LCYFLRGRLRLPPRLHVLTRCVLRCLVLCCVVLCCPAAAPAGQPPKRLQASEDENIQDVMARVEKVAEDRENERLSHDPQYKELAKKQEQLRASEQGGGDAAADV